MAFLFISLSAWLLTFFMLKYPGRNRIRFWYAMYVLTMAMGTLDVSFTKEILPALRAEHQSQCLIGSIQATAFFLNTLWPFLGTLTVFETLRLNAAAEYGRSARFVRYGFVAVFLGIVVFNFLTRQSFLVIDPEKSSAFPFSCWASLIVCLWGIGILVSSYFREQLAYLKRRRLALIFEICPLMMVLIFLVFAAPLIWGIAYVSENKFIGLLVDSAIGYLVIQHFLVAAREKFQNKYYDSTIKTAYSGITLYNHAIKNHLANITASVEMLDNCGDARRIDHYSAIIKDSVNHLLELTRRLQNQTKEMDLQLAVVNLSEIIESALRDMAPLLAEKEIVLSKKLPPELQVRVDPVHLHEVLCCIITNAVEAMESFGKLTVYAELISGDVVVSIVDDGQGISKHNLRRICEPYFTTKGSYGNFGLGLSYCQNVIRKHRGHLRIRSKEGEGTQVDLLIPPIK